MLRECLQTHYPVTMMWKKEEKKPTPITRGEETHTEINI